MGYSSLHKGYKCLSSSGKIYIAYNVVFDEHSLSPWDFQLSRLLVLIKKLWVQPQLQDFLWCYPSLTSQYHLLLKNQSTSYTPNGNSREPTQSPTTSTSKNHSTSQSIPHNDLHTDLSIPILNTHPMTRSKVGIFKPKLLTVDSTTGQPESEPNIVMEALKSNQWKKTMEAEIQALNQNQTWFIIPCLPHYNVVGHKWVYKLKYNPDGSIQRHKAWLVAKGFHQTPEVDFSETFNPVIKPTTVRIILTIVVTKGWKIQQLDVNNAFLNGKLQEIVFMSQPERFVDPEKPEYVCKLHKALYGLKQAPRAWFEELWSTLFKWGFKDSKVDTSLFLYSEGCNSFFLLLYVDDILITLNNPNLVTRLIHDLNFSFSLKDFGELHYFLE